MTKTCETNVKGNKKYIIEYDNETMAAAAHSAYRSMVVAYEAYIGKQCIGFVVNLVDKRYVIVTGKEELFENIFGEVL